jgi:hypothetical protein
MLGAEEAGTFEFLSEIVGLLLRDDQNWLRCTYCHGVFTSSFFVGLIILN